MKKLINSLNEYYLGIIIGVLFSSAAVLTNIVFPSNESDNAWEILIVYLLLFLIYSLGGYIADKGTGSFKKGAKGGALTARISMSMLMITFLVIDNLFLDIVSRQHDKMTAFASQTEYNNMRDFINSGLIRGVLVALPVITLIGAGFGMLGALISKKINNISLNKQA